MRHGNRNKKLNRTSTHRSAMLKNMSTSLIMHEQIKTTLAKAKLLRPVVEKYITIAKKGDLSSRRRLFSFLRSQLAVAKLLNVLSSRYKERNGGYLRILKAGFRYGDMAPMAVIEFVERDESAKGKDYGQIDLKTFFDETNNDSAHSKESKEEEVPAKKKPRKKAE